MRSAQFEVTDPPDALPPKVLLQVTELAKALCDYTLPTTARSEALSIWELVQFCKKAPFEMALEASGKGYVFTLKDFVALLMCASKYPGRGKRRPPMDIPYMVNKWVQIVKGLTMSHDKPTVDRVEYDSELFLIPILEAPIKQVRAFYADLVTALKRDPEIPFFVWSWFEIWGEAIMKNVPDGEVKALQTQLAEQVATLVEKDVQPDLRAALVGALKWRNPEALQRMKVAVEDGGKPRLVGRESCLFLEVADEVVML